MSLVTSDKLLKDQENSLLMWCYKQILALRLPSTRTMAGITASTTQTQGQGPLTAVVNEISVVANANDTVTLPSAGAGKTCVIINNGAQTLRIYPASGDNLGAGVNTATTLTATSRRRYVAYDSTNWAIV